MGIIEISEDLETSGTIFPKFYISSSFMSYNCFGNVCLAETRRVYPTLTVSIPQVYLLVIICEIILVFLMVLGAIPSEVGRANDVI